ncbi:MAG TPA: hypothetical protein VGV60_02775 [Candidatus Polarisedimenticolia bacterium]|nr:hypothetical protein [Candidatus Polarisedimenticolia bacterium]
MVSARASGEAYVRGFLLILLLLVLRGVGTVWGPGDTLFAARVLAAAVVMGVPLLAWAGVFERLAELGREGPRIVQVMTGRTLGIGIYAAQLHGL